MEIHYSEEDYAEVYINDLKPKKQKELLEFLELETAEDGNLDVVPIAIIPRKPCGDKAAGDG